MKLRSQVQLLHLIIFHQYPFFCFIKLPSLHIPFTHVTSSSTCCLPHFLRGGSEKCDRGLNVKERSGEVAELKLRRKGKKESGENFSPISRLNRGSSVFKAGVLPLGHSGLW